MKKTKRPKILQALAVVGKVIGKSFLVICTFVVVPVFLLSCVLPLCLLRAASILTAKLRWGRKTKILSLSSSLMSMDDFNKPLCTMVMTFLLDGPIDQSKVFQRVRETFEVDGMYPEMKQSLRRWFFFWHLVDCPQFQWSDHIIYDTKDVLTEVQLQMFRRELKDNPYDVAKPLWEVWIKGYDDGGGREDSEHKTAVLIRIHHCLGDGYSILKTLKDFFGGEIDISVARTVQYSKLQLAQFWLKFLTLTPWEVLYTYWRSKDDNIFTGKQLKETASAYEICSDDIDFDVLKRLSKKFDVSVSALLMSGFVAGIRDVYFLAQGWKIPKRFHVSCPLPVLVDFSDKHLDNNVTVLPWLIPLREPSSVDRLKIIDKLFKRKKNSELALGMCLMGRLWGLLINVFRLRDSKLPGSALWTNFPGPKTEQYILGRKVTGFRYSANIEKFGMGLGFSSFCVSGKLYVTAKCNHAVIEDPLISKRFLERTIDEYRRLDEMSPEELHEFDETHSFLENKV